MLKIKKSYNAIPFILLLQKYYSGDLTGIKLVEWNNIMNSLREEELSKNPDIEKGIKIIKNLTQSEYDNFKYDYNKLFIGPNTLLAPPYASCYLNKDRVVMQNVTLRVRKMYLDAGLEIINKNTEPDDFIAFELDFLLFLLSKENDNCLNTLNEFLKNHLLCWYEEHIKDIRKNSENPLNIGISYIFEGTMNFLKAN